MEQLELQDNEWARDWSTIVEIYEKIDEIKKCFKRLDVPYLREVQQKILLLNLKKIRLDPAKLHHRKVLFRENLIYFSFSFFFFNPLLATLKY